MPVRIHEFGESQVSALYSLADSFDAQTYWRMLQQGQLTRPAIVKPAFFSPAHIENTFAINNNVKIVIVEQAYQYKSIKLWWPWACGLKLVYKNAPVIFPYFSNSRFIMAQSFSKESKLQHLRTTLHPVLKENNLLIDFDYKPSSLTHELLMNACSKFHITYHTSPHRYENQRLRSEYWLARSRDELKTLHEKEFLQLIQPVREVWYEAYNEPLKEDYRYVPDFIDQLV